MDFTRTKGEYDPEIVTSRIDLSPEERALPLAKYWDLPFHRVGPLYRQIHEGGSMDPADALAPQNFTDLLKPAGYSKVEHGYCMMPDGTGYLAVYTTYPGCNPAMLRWYFQWINVLSKNHPKDRGNLRYKIWNPADHWTHEYPNGKDRSGGIGTVESLDLGEGEQMYYSIRHGLDCRDYGLSAEREQELRDAKIFWDGATESFHPVDNPKEVLGGTHLFLSMSRLNPWGVLEKVTREWIGWGVKDGEVVRDETTPDWMLNETYLKKVIYHSTTEAHQLSKFLPELYAEYKDKPIDAD